MKKLIFVLPVLIVFASSCVTSLQPLATYDTAIADDRLTGTWQQDDQEYLVQKLFNSDFYNKYKEQLKGEKNKGQLSEKQRKDSVLYSKSYTITYSKDSLVYYLFGSMIRLNGRLFISFTPADISSIATKENETEINLVNRLLTHTVARVELINERNIRLDFIDGGYLYDQIQAGRMKIKHESDNLFDTFLITASTTELQAFLKKYGGDNRFFGKENSVTLIRKS